jgi:chorismate synthase
MDVGSSVDMASFTMEDVESNIVRCPDQEAAQKMIDGERPVRSGTRLCSTSSNSGSNS